MEVEEQSSNELTKLEWELHKKKKLIRYIGQIDELLIMQEDLIKKNEETINQFIFKRFKELKKKLITYKITPIKKLKNKRKTYIINAVYNLNNSTEEMINELNTTKENSTILINHYYNAINNFIDRLNINYSLEINNEENNLSNIFKNEGPLESLEETIKEYQRSEIINEKKMAKTFRKTYKNINELLETKIIINKNTKLTRNWLKFKSLLKSTAKCIEHYFTSLRDYLVLDEFFEIELDKLNLKTINY